MRTFGVTTGGIGGRLLEPAAPKLIGGWVIEHPLVYAASVILAGLLVRVASSALKAIEVAIDKKASDFWSALWTALKGSGQYKDYWQPFVLGLLELAAFPVLMATDHWSYVGAWLGLKTVAQATRWKDDRSVFNRFLIGTGLVVLASYFLANMVSVIPVAKQ